MPPSSTHSPRLKASRCHTHNPSSTTPHPSDRFPQHQKSTSYLAVLIASRLQYYPNTRPRAASRTTSTDTFFGKCELLSFPPWRLNDIRVAVVRALDFRGFLADEHERGFRLAVDFACTIRQTKVDNTNGAGGGHGHNAGRKSRVEI